MIHNDNMNCADGARIELVLRSDGEVDGGVALNGRLGRTRSLSIRNGLVELVLLVLLVYLTHKRVKRSVKRATEGALA